MLDRYVFVLTPAEVRLIGQGLDKLPHGEVRPLVDGLQAQITQQEQAHTARLAAEEQRRLAEAAAATTFDSDTSAT